MWHVASTSSCQIHTENGEKQHTQFGTYGSYVFKTRFTEVIQ